jgi:hypothetical protein
MDTAMDLVKIRAGFLYVLDPDVDKMLTVHHQETIRKRGSLSDYRSWLERVGSNTGMENHQFRKKTLRSCQHKKVPWIWLMEH